MDLSLVFLISGFRPASCLCLVNSWKKQSAGAHWCCCLTTPKRSGEGDYYWKKKISNCSILVWASSEPINSLWQSRFQSPSLGSSLLLLFSNTNQHIVAQFLYLFSSIMRKISKVRTTKHQLQGTGYEVKYVMYERFLYSPWCFWE